MQLEPCVSSALLSVGTTVVVSKASCLLTSAILNPGSAACTLTIYDNGTAGSGTVICLLQGLANGASVVFQPPVGIHCSNGLTLVVAGTGSQGQAYYQRSEG